MWIPIHVNALSPWAVVWYTMVLFFMMSPLHLTTFTLGCFLIQNIVPGVEVAGSLIMAVMLVTDVAWTVLDLVLLDVAVLYVVTRNMVCKCLLLVILVRRGHYVNRNVLLTVILLVISFILLPIKIAFLACHHICSPDPRLHWDSQVKLEVPPAFYWLVITVILTSDEGYCSTMLNVIRWQKQYLMWETRECYATCILKPSANDLFVT